MKSWVQICDINFLSIFVTIAEIVTIIDLEAAMIAMMTDVAMMVDETAVVTEIIIVAIDHEVKIEDEGTGIDFWKSGSWDCSAAHGDHAQLHPDLLDPELKINPLAFSHLLVLMIYVGNAEVYISSAYDHTIRISSCEKLRGFIFKSGPSKSGIVSKSSIIILISKRNIQKTLQ